MRALARVHNLKHRAACISSCFRVSNRPGGFPSQPDPWMRTVARQVFSRASLPQLRFRRLRFHDR